jgi:arylsulfatase A-like enzyme
VSRLFELAANPPELELYDLQSDPWEWNNLAAAPEHAETLKRMQAALKEWREQTQDPLLTPEGMAAMRAMEKPMTHLNTSPKKPGGKGKGRGEGKGEGNAGAKDEPARPVKS